MTLWRGAAAVAWRYALGPVCIGAAALLLAYLFDLPHFVFLSIAAAAAAWGGARLQSAQRRRAEDALRLSEERHVLALEASDEGHFDTDLEKDETFVSARLNEILGFPRRAETVDRVEFLKRIPVHPDDRHLIAELIKPVQEDNGQDAYEFEFRIVPRPGEVRWIHTRGKVVRDTAGRARRRAGMVADVTEAKAAEEALRLSEERYARAVAGASDGIWDEDYTRDLLYRSPRNQEIALGRVSDGLDVRPRAEWAQWHHVHPDDAPKRDAALRAHLEGRTPIYEIEYRVRHPDGAYHWIHARGVCTRDASGRPLRIAGSTTNVDARKAAEGALRLSEERYALAMDASEEGHFDWNVATDEVFTSEHVKHVLWMPADVEYRTRQDFVSRMPFYPGDRERIGQIWRTALADSGVDYEFEYRLLHPKTREMRWMTGKWKVFRDEAGTAQRVIGVVRDITKRKLAELAQLESEKRYERAMLAANAGFWEWDTVNDKFHASPRLLEILGLPLDTPLAGREDFVRRVPFYPEDHDKWLRAVRQLFASGGSRLTMDLRYPRHGKAAWARLDGLCFRDEAGRVVRWTGSVTDITEGKQAEEALRLSEQRLAVALETAEEGNWDWNPQTDEIWSSPQALKVLGIPQDTAQRSRSGQLALVRLHPADTARVADEWRAALAGRSVEREFEYRILRGEPAQPRWIRSRWKIFRDDAGVAVRVMGIVADITERKLALDTITESEARFRSVIDFAPVAIALTNARSSTSGPRILQVNQEFTRMFGYAPEEIVGKEVGTLAPGDLQDAYLANVGSLDSGNKIEKECVRQRKDGSRIRVHLTGVPIRLRDETTFALLMYRDLTERELATQALRESEQRYSFAMEAAQDAHWDWIVGTEKYYTSPRAVDVLGFPPGTTFESREDYLARTPLLKEDLEVWQGKVQELFAGTGSRLSMDIRANINGEIRWIQHNGLCVRDASGKVVRWGGTVRDTTERRRAEEALRQAQRLESMGTMAGGIAHDFNNILGAIIGYGEMALRAAKKDTRLRRDLDAIMSAGERGRALVDRILAFSRSAVGERVPVHVEEVVREALDQLAARLPEGVTIAPRLRAGRAAILGDSTQVHQVVMNLANNGVQAMPNGGLLRVTLEAMRFDAARSAKVGAVSPGDYIVLKVSDAGTGIAPEVLERMFDPFFTTKEVGVGSGLGLSLVHGIVANVGGAIDVATELGRGTTFTVYFPRSGDAPAKARNEKKPLPRGAGERVLVVDDEEPLVRLATETLERLGYAAVGFTSSSAALAAFRADPQRFDAVLTDERMPGMSGTALIREVRGIRDAIPVVLMSGYLGVAPRDARAGGIADALGVAPITAVGVGANVIVKKPLSERELATSMARALHP